MNKDTCKFFNGTFHNECCLAGVKYRDVTTDPDNMTGVALRVACHTRPFGSSSPIQLEHFNRRGTCSKLTLPTELELAEHEAEWEQAWNRMKATFPLIARIKKEHKGQSWQGVEKCPVCGGKLHVTHAAINGHVWGKCETEDCLDWME